VQPVDTYANGNGYSNSDADTNPKPNSQRDTYIHTWPG